MCPASDICHGWLYDTQIFHRLVCLGEFNPSVPRSQAESKVVILLILEAMVSSLIVTAILKGSNTGFRKTDKLMKRIAMYVRCGIGTLGIADFSVSLSKLRRFL
jgi:hypothetical protein